ncbi:hypothetical protein J500_2831 [Acinetobacter sp. 479375]|nr:hypothetical protein J500_2831 [Acinetobacter sp. 479375]
MRFLSGVCRHERYNSKARTFAVFLSGVCRHELYAELKLIS